MSVRAFELVPAIERLELMSEKARTEIECVECCGKNLYIGTSDCFVVHYIIQEKSSPTHGKTVYQTEKQGHKYLAVKKPVVKLKAASALNRILVLCDNTLILLNMFNLEPIMSGAKVKGVTNFCLNENPTESNPFSVEICVALKKKVIQIYTVTEDKVILVKDISTSEPAATLCMNGTSICAAFPTQYKMINFVNGASQELFPYESEKTKAFITKIDQDEFLLSAPSALGMFVLAEGISQRPPLQWSDNLVSVVYVHPYILALNDEFITVHSILDQQQKQSIPFQGGHFMGEFDGRIFVSSSKEIYALAPIAMEKQIQSLLTDGRVAEALDLAKNARKTGLSKENFIKMYRRIQQQAGFIEFSQMRFDEANELFKNSHLDVRELISLYPNLMPSGSNFSRAIPPLHEIADVVQLSRHDQSKILQYKEFLLPYLEEIRGTKEAVGCKVETDTALLKLYAELQPDGLEMFITSESVCDMQDCIGWLEEFHRYYAMGMLYKFSGDVDKALNIWTRIVDGELQDETFPGFSFIVQFLANSNDHELVWNYVDWVLEKDEEMGIKIFTERPQDEPKSERLRPETVVEYLARFPKAVIIFLEYLVFERKLEKESYHTHLAVLYLDNVLQLMKNKNGEKVELDKARSKLRHMLEMSNLYRVQLILGKVKETDMHIECAILYGKLEEHEKALRILVHKLKDFTAAENHCLVNSQGRDVSFRKRLFQTLLGVYLDPTYEKRDNFVAPAITLLNNNKADFDTVKVLQLIPDNWSIGLLHMFLTSSIRKSLNGSRTIRLERMLARGENLLVKSESIQQLRECVSLEEKVACAVCSRGFSEPGFVRYPNGVLSHIHCAKNKNICPVTGKLFSIKCASQNDKK